MATSIRSSSDHSKTDWAARAARAAVVLAAALGVVACGTTDKRTGAEKAADVALAEQVHAALRADSNVYASHIEVNAKDGVVWLTGFVDAAGQDNDAASATKAVPGVRRVINQIEVVDWSTYY